MENPKASELKCTIDKAKRAAAIGEAVERLHLRSDTDSLLISQHIEELTEKLAFAYKCLRVIEAVTTFECMDVPEKETPWVGKCFMAAHLGRWPSCMPYHEKDIKDLNALYEQYAFSWTPPKFRNKDDK